MYYCYVLQSKTSRKHYIGITDNVARHFLSDHNNGVSTWTKNKGPWCLVWKKNSPIYPKPGNLKIC